MITTDPTSGVPHKFSHRSYWIARILFFVVSILTFFSIATIFIFSGLGGSLVTVILVPIGWLFFIIAEIICLRKLEKIYKNQIETDRNAEIMISLLAIVLAIMPYVYVNIVYQLLHIQPMRQQEESYVQWVNTHCKRGEDIPASGDESIIYNTDHFEHYDCDNGTNFNRDPNTPWY